MTNISRALTNVSRTMTNISRAMANINCALTNISRALASHGRELHIAVSSALCVKGSIQQTLSIQAIRDDRVPTLSIQTISTELELASLNDVSVVPVREKLQVRNLVRNIQQLTLPK